MDTNTRLEEFVEKAFASFLEVTPDAVVVANQDGRIFSVNTQAERIFQSSRAEMLGSLIEMLFPERYREQQIQQLVACWTVPAQSSREACLVPIYCLRSDGSEFPAEIRFGVIQTAVGLLIFNAIKDVSEQVRFEAELKQRTHQLDEAKRRNDELLGIVAHELRNPLAAIGMAVEALRQQQFVEGSEKLLDIISRQAQQTQCLIEDLMDVSRVAHGKIRIQQVPVELAPLLRQAIEAVEPLLIAFKHQLTVSLPPRPVKLSGDAVRLVEVFTNLLDNAAKYTEEGGLLSLIAEEEANEVVIEFRDSGIGIPSEMLPCVFEPYIQVIDTHNRSNGGIGIGLAMVAHLVRLHCGTIEVFSDGPGQGTRYVVRLPIFQSKP